MSTMNHSSVIGPKARPMPPVPKRCAANRSVSTAIVIGSTASCSAGEAAATSRPSTADSTLIAGVVDAVAVEDGGAEHADHQQRASQLRPVRPPALVASASIAISPPSPWLSARRISSTYFKETMTVIVQKISDSTPSTLVCDIGTWPAWKTSFSA